MENGIAPCIPPRKSRKTVLGERIDNAPYLPVANGIGEKLGLSSSSNFTISPQKIKRTAALRRQIGAPGAVGSNTMSTNE